MATTSTTSASTRRPSAADRKNARQAADQARLQVVPSGGSGKSVTGDNGKGHAKADRPAQPVLRVKPAKPLPTAVASAKPLDEPRYRAAISDGKQTITCQPTCANGHITAEAATACERKLLRVNGDGWTASPPVRVDRYRGLVTPNAKGGKPIECECKFSHKTQDAAIECAGRLARQQGMIV